MNKQIIWLIIGVMSLAVIGVVALQTDLIMTSIRANEEAFEKNVQNALSMVANRTEAASHRDDILVYANGYNSDYFDVDGVLNGENGGMSIPIGGSYSSASDTYHNQLLAELLVRTGAGGLCEECRVKNNLGSSFTDAEVKKVSYDYQNVQIPIQDRIDANRLTKVLEQELVNHAIKTPYEFGVYSNELETFVIRNGQYLLGTILAESQGSQAEYAVLENSPYGVTLFAGENGEVAGQLKIFFPDEVRLVWSSLLPSFIGTFFLAALILGCFGYTVWVIFHQKRVSEMKTDFINNMTHEFKTPIATISLAADSIENPRIHGEVSKVLRFANIIKQENKRMNSQVEKVLQMAQIDRGESRLRLTEVNLHDVISRAVENIGLQVEPRGGSAKAVLTAKKPSIEGDLTHISNVVNNLLDNANKYSPEAPEIVVTTSERKDGVVISVLDHGMGMTKEARKHIFDKFYRVHTGDLHDIKGFGLGLSYVKAIVDAHKGSIEVKSEPGKGSEFILFFPRRQEARRNMMG